MTTYIWICLFALRIWHFYSYVAEWRNEISMVRRTRNSCHHWLEYATIIYETVKVIGIRLYVIDYVCQHHQTIELQVVLNLLSALCRRIWEHMGIIMRIIRGAWRKMYIWLIRPGVNLTVPHFQFIVGLPYMVVCYYWLDTYCRVNNITVVQASSVKYVTCWSLQVLPYDLTKSDEILVPTELSYISLSRFQPPKLVIYKENSKHWSLVM